MSQVEERLEALYAERESILDDLEAARVSIHDAETAWQVQDAEAAQYALRLDLGRVSDAILQLGGELPDQ